MRTARRESSGSALQGFFIVLFAIIVAIGVAVAVARQFGWEPPLLFGTARTTVEQPSGSSGSNQPADRGRAALDVQPTAPVIAPTAYVPIAHEVQYQAAPPADTPPEEVQPRTEIVQVDRAPSQTTIIRTVPQRPAGPPIVIDRGVKRMGAP